MTQAILKAHKDVWCVWTKGGRRPRFFHTTEDGAEREAARLANRHPNRKFIVMHMTAKFFTVNKLLPGAEIVPTPEQTPCGHSVVDDQDLADHLRCLMLQDPCDDETPGPEGYSVAVNIYDLELAAERIESRGVVPYSDARAAA